MDWAIAGAAVSIVAAFTAILTFWLNFSDRISKASATAETAIAESKATAARAEALSADQARFREQVAKEYVSRESIRELEERLVNAIERLGDRLDKLFETGRPAPRTRRPQD